MAKPSKLAGLVSLDYTGCLADRVGKAGLTARQIEVACRKAGGAKKRLRAELDSGRRGFDCVLDDVALIASAVSEGRRLAAAADTLIVDGIGGSALGPLALYTALRPKKRLVVLDNVDPEGVAAKLAALDPAKVAVNVITKSGSTAETMANLLVLLDWAQKSGQENPYARWTATTDPERGDLLTLAQRLGIPTCVIPPNVGGRFSVLTPVGLLPAAFLGLDVEAFIAGARAMREHCWQAPAEKNMGVLGAVLLRELYLKRGRSVQVLMPYADSLVLLADWYRQLWAESLGKRTNRAGKRVEIGQTPVTSLGATDQHSQVQLYVEGPHDKVVTFFEVEKWREDVRIPNLHGDLTSLGYLGGRTLGELISAEKRGTEIALTDAGRPNFTWKLPTVSEHVLGQLIFLFAFQTALSGELYEIDAFDQPGVEGGKIATYALMGRKGYEKESTRLQREMRKKRALV